MLLALALVMVGLFPASATTFRLSATADAWVRADRQNANNGASASLRVLENMRMSYLRFKVPAPPSGEEIGSAILRLDARSPAHCTPGVEVLRAASDTWGEATITWKNQPGVTGDVLATANWTTGGYKEFDVTEAVTGRGPVSFVIRHAAGCNPTEEAVFDSREAVSDPPELVVETVPATPDPHCSDALDNDGDGRVDFPQDPGCVSSTDGDETDPSIGTKTLVAAGDLVCSPDRRDFDGSNASDCQHRATAALVGGADAVAPLGDLQYPDGRLEYFVQAYDPSWGQHAAKTYPVPGNHEYNTVGAQGYFDYWASKGRPTGGGAGYYSYDLGSWHVIALNSSRSCAEVPCVEGSPQNDWLEVDLTATTERCILAYWHHPRFNSGAGHTDTPGTAPLWDDLYAARADIVLAGHEHNYQRYAKQDPAARATPEGIRQFIVGSGGRSLTPLAELDPNFEVGNATHFGVLKLMLASSSYSWQYVGIDGTVLDSGGPVACN